MKRAKEFLLLSFLGFFCFILNTKAACDYDTQVKLATEAANVNVTYEIKKRIINVYTGEVALDATDEDVEFDGDYAYENKIFISLMNINENIYIEMTGSNGFNEIYYYDDSNNGSIEIDGGLGEEIVNYKIIVKSVNEECNDKALRSIDFVTPMKNPYSDLLACEGVNEYYCQPYVTYEIDLSEGQVIDKAMEIKNNKENENQNEENKNWWEEWLEKNKWFVPTLVGVIVLAGVATTVIIIRKRRSKVI